MLEESNSAALGDHVKGPLNAVCMTASAAHASDVCPKLRPPLELPTPCRSRSSLNAGESEQMLHGQQQYEQSIAQGNRVSQLVASLQRRHQTPLQSGCPQTNSTAFCGRVADRLPHACTAASPPTLRLFALQQQAAIVGPAQHSLAPSSQETPRSQTAEALSESQMGMTPRCQGMGTSVPSMRLRQAAAMLRHASAEASPMPTFRMLSPKEIADMLEPGETAVLQAGSPQIVNLLDFHRTEEAEDEEDRDTESPASSPSTSLQSGSPRDETYLETNVVVCTPNVTHRPSHARTTLALAEPNSLQHLCNIGVVGVAGGAAGAVAGSAVGAVLGIPTAIMTLGLSVPVYSGAGATAGFFTGGIMGAVAGARGTTVTVVYEDEPAQAPKFQKSNSSRLTVCIENQETDVRSRKRTLTLASAFGGGVVMGSLGGASGTAVGGLAGATIGLVPAPFTLGLSIPIGATIGTGIGFLTGTLAGLSAGVLGGGLAAKSSFAYADGHMAVAE